MKKLSLCLILSVVGILIASSAVYAQEPDLLFAQLAVGGTPELEIESVLTVTNLGSELFEGTLRFWTGPGDVWNPLVEGEPTTGGQVEVSIGALSTESIRVTGTDLTAGYGVLTSDDSAPGLVEGNLTYFLLSNGDIVDSVGVAPSVGLHRATIPFADFSTIALALANTQATDNVVNLTLRSEEGAAVETVELVLEANAHSSRFLNEIFDANLQGGRVDVGSEDLFFGTAVTLTSGQISTLPMLPAEVEYDVRVMAQDGTITLGNLSMLAEGTFVRGSLELTSEDGVVLPTPARTRIGGRLVNGNLRLAFYAGGPEFFNEDVVIYVEASGFSFALESFTAEFVETELADRSTNIGIFELTRRVQP
jgi:hypothetical protein